MLMGLAVPGEWALLKGLFNEDLDGIEVIVVLFAMIVLAVIGFIGAGLLFKKDNG